MPCNTAHNYYEQVCEAVTIPVLHMIALTRDALKARGVKCVGLLATDGTVRPASTSAPLSKAAWSFSRRTAPPIRPR